MTLAPEGGAHHSVITPSIGLEQPQCIAWEPAFGQDLEWTMLHALSRLGRADGTSSYFRLSTRPIAQDLAAVPTDPLARERRRVEVIAGDYRLRTAAGTPAVVLAGTGAILPEVLSAATELEEGGIAVDVLCITSADLVFRAWRSMRGLAHARGNVIDTLFPSDRRAPLVSVIDGYPHTLSFLGGIASVPTVSLGVDDFGQSGEVLDLYHHFGIDTESIVDAALDLLGR